MGYPTLQCRFRSCILLTSLFNSWKMENSKRKAEIDITKKCRGSPWVHTISNTSPTQKYYERLHPSSLHRFWPLLQPSLSSQPAVPSAPQLPQCWKDSSRPDSTFFTGVTSDRNTTKTTCSMDQKCYLLASWEVYRTKIVICLFRSHVGARWRSLSQVAAFL